MSYHLICLTFEWSYEHLITQISGMKKYIESRKDVELTVFNAVAKYLDQEVETSALEILHMPDLSKYDGVLIQGNRSWPQEERQRIVDEAQRLCIPVVSINYPLAHATEIGTDNFSAIMELMDHLYTEQHVRKTVFLCGYPKSLEAQTRKKAYLVACEKYKIENLGCYGDGWQTENGEKECRMYLESGKKLPDCFVCANDNNARGVINELEKHHIRVPEDVLVTGFDNQELAYAYSPRITSIDRDYEHIGYLAVESLMDKIEGKQVPVKVYSPYKIILQTSSGYTTGDNDEDFRVRFLDVNKSVHDFHKIHSHFEPKLLACNSILEIGTVLEDFGACFGLPEVFVALDAGYFANFEDPENISHYSEKSHLLAVSGVHGLHPDTYTHFYTTYSTTDVLPSIVAQHNDLYMVYPLHYGSTVIGFVVTLGIPDGASYGFMSVYLSLLENAFENMRKKALMALINKKLDELYIRDQLTGCYNRFGMDKYGKQEYYDLLQKNGKVYLIFADIDNMKHINDSYGHECGDEAIRITAKKLKETLGKDRFIMRYGGDEFLAILPVSHEDMHLHTQKHTVTMPDGSAFEMSFSIGEVCIEQKEKLPLDKAIEKADARMYALKKQKKGAVSR